MRIKLVAIEDQVQGGFGWIIDTIDGEERFDYDEYLTAQSQIGDLLAHDVLEHGCRVEQPNLDELAALGAILASREWDFYNGRNNNMFASEIAEQLRGLIHWNGLDDKFPVCSSHDDYVAKYYDEFRGQIESYIEDELEELASEYDDDFDIDEFDWANLHQCVISYLAKGYNEVSRKEARYQVDFHHCWSILKDAIDDATDDIDAEEASYCNTKIYINFS
ncbi:MAG: hypothetical protein QNJ41_17935 [Xenococcaceae cyanobacterium MO_188.B32]|nr:hypothetical protein [Xenococcaceae cyanobacterium MO_188.B32]